MTGLSGGGWTTTIISALDIRIAKAFPTAGSFPLYIPLLDGGGSRDWEQLLHNRGVSENYTDCYILGSVPNRRLKQIHYLYDDCCFGMIDYATGIPYAPLIQGVVNGLGGSYDLIWQDKTTHQFYPDVIAADVLPEL